MAVQKIGRYRVLRELGRGSAAIVYQGRDPDSGKQVALKVFYTTVIRAEGFAERFHALLPTVAALDHPYLVPLLDWQQEGGEAPGDEVAFYLVQRYMPGGSLAERMDGRPMLLAEVVPILQRLAEALDAAHGAGLLHGAVNPGHALFDLNNRAFLADLGLAMLLHDLPTGGALPLPGLPAGRPAGLPAYWSPEQITGLPLDGRADVYALGVMVYEMLTGRQPYVAEATGGLLLQHLEAPVPQLSEAQLARLVLPAEFNHVLARALAKNREARYTTAGILAEAMRAVFLMAPGELAALDVRATPPIAAPLVLPGEPPAPAPAAVVPEAPGVTPPPPAPEVSAAPSVESAAPAADAGPDAPLEAEAPAPAAQPTGAAVEGAPPEATPEAETSAAPPAGHPHSAPVVVPLAPADAAPEVTEWTEAPEAAPPPALPGWGWVGGGLVLLLLLWMLWRSPAVRAIVNPPTATPTATATHTPTLTATITQTPSATPTATTAPSATATVTVTPTRRPTITPSATISPTPSDTPTVTHTATFIPTWTHTPAPPTETSSAPSAPLITATP
ncbi:MAG: protein kinase [Anaerolineales bacterium]|nr:protein kinase [Anaerolineales bacterium]